MLLGVFLVSLWATAATVPQRRARQISLQLSDGELIGQHQYMNRETLAIVNTLITASQSDLPPFSHSYVVTVLEQSLLDFLLFYQSICIEYTTHPVLPRYQGEISRHRVEYTVGISTVVESGRTKKVLYEYYE